MSAADRMYARESFCRRTASARAAVLTLLVDLEVRGLAEGPELAPHLLAAVHGQHVARDVARGGAGEERARLRHLVHGAHAAHRVVVEARARGGRIVLEAVAVDDPEGEA